MEENNLTNAKKNGSDGSKMAVLDYEDVEFSNQELHSSTNMGSEIPSCESMDNILDELLRDNHGCTHFHTCDPPGPVLPHTHTCVHVHTKKLGSSSKEDGHNDDDNCGESSEQSGRKRGWERGGNREAVRKYRLKKKAYTASLADELVKLRAFNQQLMQRLQSRVTLETEVARLKCLLVDIRGRIQGEIGSFPYQKPVQSLDMHLNVETCLPDGQSGEGVSALNGRDCNASGFENLNCNLHNL